MHQINKQMAVLKKLIEQKAKRNITIRLFNQKSNSINVAIIANSCRNDSERFKW